MLLLVEGHRQKVITMSFKVVCWSAQHPSPKLMQMATKPRLRNVNFEKKMLPGEALQEQFINKSKIPMVRSHGTQCLDRRWSTLKEYIPKELASGSKHSGNRDLHQNIGNYVWEPKKDISTKLIIETITKSCKYHWTTCSGHKTLEGLSKQQLDIGKK